MGKVFERVIVFIVAAIFLVWGGYHIVRYTNESIEFETVFQETIPRSLTGRGVAIRDEIPLGSSGEGTPHFLYKDGTKIGIGQPVAEFYTGSVKNRNIQSIRDIEDDINMLEKAQNKNVNNYSSAPIISRDIREQLALLNQMSSTGKCSDLPTIEKEIENLINRRHIATGKGENFNNRITELKAQLVELKSESDLSSIKTSVAPQSGFFAKNNDGLETALTTDKIDYLGVNDYLTLIEQDLAETHNQNGRLVINSKWYFAVCVPKHQTEWVREGQTAKMNFSQFTEPVSTTVYKVLTENNNNMAVIILTSDLISEDTLNIRMSDVTLSFSNFTGLKINSSNIRFRENDMGETERGVFVLENHVVTFKTVDVIYEESSFVISRMNYADSQNKKDVRLFDQIIVRGGNDIYDGKIIQ